MAALLWQSGGVFCHNRAGRTPKALEIEPCKTMHLSLPLWRARPKNQSATGHAGWLILGALGGAYPTPCRWLALGWPAWFWPTARTAKWRLLGSPMAPPMACLRQTWQASTAQSLTMQLWIPVLGQPKPAKSMTIAPRASNATPNCSTATNPNVRRAPNGAWDRMRSNARRTAKAQPTPRSAAKAPSAPTACA